MPVAIPQSSGEYRYRGVAEAKHPATAFSAGDALRAFAEDLLANGDVQVALERAFRWGYRNDQSEHVTGLQEHLLHLRQQRERILRQVQNEHFLEALSPELDRLDRLDALDRDPGQHLGEVDDESQHPLDRLIARLTHRYRSPEAQAGLEELLHDMRDAADPEGSARARSDTHTGESQPASVFGDMRSTANASADTLRRMLFSGGLDAVSRSAGTWRCETSESPVRSSLRDLALLTELEAVEEAIAQFEAIGGVSELVEIDLGSIGDDDLVDWLRQWQLAIASVAPAGSAAVTGSIPLPPDVISAIGRDLLKGLFRAARAPVTGEHQSMSRGNAGDPSETSVSWEPGRPLDLDLVATVSSAVRRGAGAGKGRVRLEPDDFVVVERASAISVSTVLAIDRSRSMGQSGAWIAAKKVGMAMHELIRQSYPRDSLGIVTFSSTATKVDIRDIPQLEWDRYEHGTHLQAALALGRRMLRNRSSGTRQIVVVTDGEPTLATVHGVEVFASPPTDEVLEATMSEVVRCTRENITINIVMLGEGPGSRFAEQVARVNRGRVFVASSHSLGTFILRDYITR